MMFKRLIGLGLSFVMMLSSINTIFVSEVLEEPIDNTLEILEKTA